MRPDMLKKIPPDQVRQGMYVARIEGPWLQHGFWRGAFLVRGEEQVQALQDPGVQALWIDTARGEDLEPMPDAAAASQAPRVQLIDDISIDTAQAPQAIAAMEAPRPAAAPTPRRPLREELSRARRVFLRSKPMLESLFAQARLGRSLDTARAQEFL